jgi:hypothetical protein
LGVSGSRGEGDGGETFAGIVALEEDQRLRGEEESVSGGADDEY